MKLRIFLYLLALTLYSGCSSKLAPTPIKTSYKDQKTINRTNPWILIDSQTEELKVINADAGSITFKNLAFGTSGVGLKNKKSDDVTPKGLYKIAWISKQSKFHRFIGINYPSIADAERGLKNKVITQETYQKILDAHFRGGIPPQNTDLGGFLGIHGVGQGSLEIHKYINWTAGCVALENQQIDELIKLVKVGIDVEIK